MTLHPSRLQCLRSKARSVRQQSRRFWQLVMKTPDGLLPVPLTKKSKGTVVGIAKDGILFVEFSQVIDINWHRSIPLDSQSKIFKPCGPKRTLYTASHARRRCQLRGFMSGVRGCNMRNFKTDIIT